MHSSGCEGVHYTECIPVVREDFGHQVEEIVVVFTEEDSLEGDLS